jgi:hypothetical protein
MSSGAWRICLTAIPPPASWPASFVSSLDAATLRRVIAFGWESLQL